MSVQDILAAISVAFSFIPPMLYALSFGFMAAPTAIGFGIGCVGMMAYGSVMPIAIQAETIALAGTMGKTVRERLSSVFFAGIIMAIVGGFGFLQVIMDFAGDNIIYAMQAGVGIILVKVATGMVKENKPVGISSIAIALIVYCVTQDLVYVVVASMVVAIIVNLVINKNKEPAAVAPVEKYKWAIHKPILNFNVARTALALSCLTIGANIAFGGITSGMSGAEANINGLTVYSGLADAGSALFGGAPVEAVISMTGAAPHPMVAGILMMVIMAVILLTGLLPKLARYLPAASITGFLFVLGAIVTTPLNTFLAFNGAAPTDALASGMTLTVTALIDPFVGLVAGIIIRAASLIFGLGI